MTPDRLMAALGGVSALIAVALGAFGAHALRPRLTPELLAVFETGARYQMYHALAILAAAFAFARHSPARSAGTRARVWRERVRSPMCACPVRVHACGEHECAHQCVRAHKAS